MAELTDEFTLVVGDEKASSANSVALYRNTSGELVFKDGTAGEKSLDSLSTISAHAGLSGLDNDDHDTGVSAYHTDARHLTVHDNTFNNDLAISGAIEADATLGAHVSNADIHYLRPVQTLTVAEGGSGQFATIASALAVANANADSSTPYEVAIYPGIYQENNLTVADFVSLRAVIPWQVSIGDSSANPILIIAAESLIDGILISANGAGPGIQFTSAATGNVYLDHVSVASNTGSALDFNATTQDVNLDNSSRISSLAGPLISGKTGVCRIVARNTEFNYGGASAVASIIDIDASEALTAGPDLFDSCQFYADNLIGGTTPASFIDWDANILWLRNCQFLLGVNTDKTVNAILAQSGVVDLQGCKFDWALTAGTPYDFNAAATAAIQHAATVYDVAKTTGAGTISALSEGAALFDNIVSTGALSMSAPDNPLINLTPSGTADTNVISITPSAALAGANTWRGIYVDGAALDPAAINALVFGGHIDLSGIDQTQDPDLCGLLINMPPAATTSGEFHAIKMTGGGNTLILLNKDFLIDLTATSGIPLQATFSGSATNTIAEGFHVKHLTSADMVNTFGIRIVGEVEDDASGNIELGDISWERTDGTDNSGLMRIGVAQSGTIHDLITLGDGTGLVTFPQAENSAAGAGPVRFGTAATGLDITDDGTGAVLDCSGGDPLIIGDTVAVKLGDAAGAEEFQILDSGNAVVFSVDSNGVGDFASNVFVDGQLQIAQFLLHQGDTDTGIEFTSDKIRFIAGNLTMLSLIEAATDECVVNDDGLDIDFRVESLTKSRAIVCDGATAAVTMAGTLTVGDSGEVNMLGVTDGTNTAMLGYNGVPHIAITGDTSWIVSAEDTDSDMNLIVRANGTGTARSRAQTSGGDWIGINHDGVRGSIDSSLGGIRLSDNADFQGTAEFNGVITMVGGGGLEFAQVYAHGIADAINSVAINDYDQIVGFATNGNANGSAVPDHTNDHITVGNAGRYNVTFDWSGYGPATVHDWIFSIGRNNRATDDFNAAAHVESPSGSKVHSVSAGGIVDCAANDTIELWVQRLSAGNNIALTTAHCSITVTQIGGT